MQIADLVTVVVPTLARPPVAVLLGSLDRAAREAGEQVPVVLVDDRRAGPPLHTDPWRHLAITLRHGESAGPARARELGAQGATSRWVCFLDEDVVPDTNWLATLVQDLTSAWPDTDVVIGRQRPAVTSGRDFPPDVAVRRGQLARTDALPLARAVVGGRASTVRRVAA